MYCIKVHVSQALNTPWRNIQRHLNVCTVFHDQVCKCHDCCYDNGMKQQSVQKIWVKFYILQSVGQDLQEITFSLRLCLCYSCVGDCSHVAVGSSSRDSKCLLWHVRIKDTCKCIAQFGEMVSCQRACWATDYAASLKPCSGMYSVLCSWLTRGVARIIVMGFL